jgi:hypothetical protein
MLQANSEISLLLDPGTAKLPPLLFSCPNAGLAGREPSREW